MKTFFGITQLSQISLGTLKTPEALLHKEASIYEEPTVLKANRVV